MLELFKRYQQGVVWAIPRLGFGFSPDFAAA